MTVTLPDHTAEIIERLRTRKAIAEPAEYLESLVLQDWLNRNRERIDALLIEGLDSGPSIPFTPQDWEEMRERLQTRLAAQHPERPIP